MKHYFAAANTGNGFASFFESIYDRENWNKIYLIKGGSGVGKSTALKRIGEVFESKGYDVEGILCSSDPKSYDGINIPELKMTFLDATAPHAMEATIPMILEEIVDLAQFLDEVNLVENRDIVKECLAYKKKAYNDAYSYLKTASSVMNINKVLYKAHINKDKIEKTAEELCERLITGEKDSKGKNRLLLSEAFSYKGYEDMTESLLTNKAVYTTKHTNEYANSIFMRKIIEIANQKGYDTESYLYVFDNDIVKSVVIKELNLAFTPITNKKFTPINISTWYKKTLKNSKPHIEKNNKVIDLLLELAKEMLISSFEKHEIIEDIYSSSMNFELANKYIDNILFRYK